MKITLKEYCKLHIDPYLEPIIFICLLLFLLTTMFISI